MSWLVSALVLAQFATDVFENDAAFEQLDVTDGVTVSRRAIAGSAFFEYRIAYDAPLSADELCRGVFEWGTKVGDGPGVKKHAVLVDTADRRVVYDQISEPMVADRDYALTVTRERLVTGACRIRFRITNDAAPPKPERYVRMDRLWGEWHFQPLERGARLTYTMFSDPGGSIPAFLVHGTARKITRQTAVMAVEKARQFLEVKK
ncbi:MAG: hypothetical protein ACOZQL_05265 [Myxococcota bacterium]